MKNNSKLLVIASALGLLTLMVGSGVAFVVLQGRGASMPATSVSTATTTKVTTTKIAPIAPPPAPVEAASVVVQPAENAAQTQPDAPILPAVTTVGAAEAQSLQTLLGDGLQLVTPDHTYEVSAGELGSWINKDGVTWNDYMLHKKIRGIAREQDQAPQALHVIDSSAEVVDGGVPGVSIDQDASYALLVKTLTGGLTTRSITLPSVVTQPPAQTISAAAQPTITNAKQIVVVLSEQRLYAWNNGRLDKSYLISAGLTLPTPLGDYAIQTRYENGCMSGPDYHLCNIHWIQYFTGVGHSFHEAYWHHNFGHPMSHGCINMTLEASHWLWDWATYGTAVHIVE